MVFSREVEKVELFYKKNRFPFLGNAFSPGKNVRRKNDSVNRFSRLAEKYCYLLKTNSAEFSAVQLGEKN